MAILGHRLRALIRKEFAQIRRDRRLAISLIVPPVLQLLLFGFALDATVSNLKLGIVDESRTPESRELVATLSESKSFQPAPQLSLLGGFGRRHSQASSMPALVIPLDLRAQAAARTNRDGAVPAQRHERQHGGHRRRATPKA